MTDEEKEVPEGGEPKPEQLTIQKAYEQAEASLEKPEAKESETPKPAPPEAKPAAEESEHIKWVKRVEGLVDKATGEINLDRLAKQAYEANRAFQSRAQEMSQFRQLLADPEFKEIVERKLAGKPLVEKAPAPVKEEEKSDEDVLREFVQEQAKAVVAKAIEPYVQRDRENQVVVEKYIQSELKSAGEQMAADYGSEEFESTIWPGVYERISQFAQAANVTPEIAIRNLCIQGQWLSTMQNIANNIVAPKLRQQLADVKRETESKELEAKKKTRLTPKGSPEKSVKPDIKVRSIRDAARAAEADHPEFAELK